MAITTDRTNSYVQEMLQGIHAVGDTYKLALIKTGHTGTYNASNTNVGTPGSGSPGTANLGTDEVSGQGYTSGGITLGAPSVTVSGRRSMFDFAAPAALNPATFSVDGAIIYNSSKGGRILGVFAFANAPVQVSGGSFSITVPTVGTETSLITAE